MKRSERMFMAPSTSRQHRIRALEMEAGKLKEYLKAREGKPWSSGAVNARTRLQDVERTLGSLRSAEPRSRISGNTDPRIVRGRDGQEYLAPTPPGGNGPTPGQARNVTTPVRKEREPWRSPPVRVENVCGGRKVERFVEVPREELSRASLQALDEMAHARASNGGREPVYMPIP